MVNQIEFHPGAYNQQIVDYCSENQIVIESWGPLGQGRVFGNATLEMLAKKYGKSLSQICLRWCVQHDIVPLPKSAHKERIIENLDILNFELSKEDMELIDNNENFKVVGSNYYNRK
jgi:diketogulonate reductase-like aldo/keto reductase